MGDSGNAVKGLKPSSTDIFWRDTLRRVVHESIGRIEGASRQIIAITSFLEGIYFAAISFSEVRGALSGWTVGLFLLPIALWLVSLFFAIRVFVPRLYETNLRSPDIAEETYLAIVAYKQENLQRAHWVLLVSFAVLLVDVWVYLRMG